MGITNFRFKAKIRGNYWVRLTKKIIKDGIIGEKIVNPLTRKLNEKKLEHRILYESNLINNLAK